MERVASAFWLFPLLFFGLAVAAGYYGDVEAAKSLGLAAVICAAIAHGVRLVWRRIKTGGTTEDEFLAWLSANRDLVLQGTAMFRGTRITADTELVRFLTVASAGVVTYRTPSRFYIRGVESTGWVNLAYTTATFLVGWWGIPWGLVYTPMAIFRNLSGGERVTVGEILAHVELGAEEKPEASSVARM